MLCEVSCASVLLIATRLGGRLLEERPDLNVPLKKFFFYSCSGLEEATTAITTKRSAIHATSLLDFDNLFPVIDCGPGSWELKTFTGKARASSTVVDSYRKVCM